MKDVVKWYYDAIHNNKNYRFVTEALTRQEENYRLQTINLAFIKVDLKNFHSWVSHHPVLEKIFPSPQNKFASLESDLKNFIDLRNEASHRSLKISWRYFIRWIFRFNYCNYPSYFILF
ncbi:hypothetical protein ACLFLN_20360 [Acinetobacter pittii]